MSGLRFKVGDIAQFAVASTVDGLPDVGKIVEVAYVGPLLSVEEIVCDYACHMDGKAWGCVDDFQLRRLDPTAEPASLTRQCEEGVEA